MTTSPAPVAAIEIRHDFTLKDAAGHVHEYVVHLHPASRGQRVMLRLMGLAAEPLGRVISAGLKLPEVLTAITAHLKGAGDGVGDVDVAKIVGQFDWSQIGGDVRSVLVDDAKADALLRDLFACCVRDGQDMASDLNYDRAYRGNYGELLQAAWKIIQVNRFFPLTGIF